MASRISRRQPLALQHLALSFAVRHGRAGPARQDVHHLQPRAEEPRLLERLANRFVSRVAEVRRHQDAAPEFLRHRATFPKHDHARQAAAGRQREETIGREGSARAPRGRELRFASRPPRRRASRRGGLASFQSSSVSRRSSAAIGARSERRWPSMPCHRSPTSAMRSAIVRSVNVRGPTRRARPPARCRARTPARRAWAARRRPPRTSRRRRCVRCRRRCGRARSALMNSWVSMLGVALDQHRARAVGEAPDASRSPSRRRAGPRCGSPSSPTS